MVLRLKFAVICLTLIGMGVLAIRQQDRATSREASACHEAINRNRLATRTLQTEISAKTSPEDITAACKRVKLPLEPVDPPGQVLPEPEAAKGAQ